MKAVIVNCMADMVKEKYGRAKWEQCLEAAGMNKLSYFLSTQDIEDGAVMKLVEAGSRVLGMNMSQLADAYGDYWVNTYAQKIYKVYFRGASSAKDFLLKMDQLHETVTQNIANARPPRFEYRWKNDKTLVMSYKSERGMIDFLMGLVKGVGKHFNERLNVVKLNNRELEVTFP